LIGFHTTLSIFDLEPLDLQIDALPESQSILAESRILRQFGYKQQMHLKRGFLRAIERLEWVIHASKDIEQFEKSILADDYIGEVIRRYPLLFKGIKG
jgi:hypothetical protein